MQEYSAEIRKNAHHAPGTARPGPDSAVKFYRSVTERLPGGYITVVVFLQTKREGIMK